MNTFRNLIKQISDIWAQAAPAQRAALIAAGAVLTLAVIGVGVWSARPQYVILASGLSPNESHQVAARLDDQGISYRWGSVGSKIEVNKRDLNIAIQVAHELIDSGKVATGSIDSSIMTDPIVNEHNLHKHLEDSLAQTIQSFQGIETATVHIGRPDDSPFISQQQPVTASVVLHLKPNGGFSGYQANTVALTVARAVDGLLPENVTVSDTKGRQLSRDGSAADIDGQLEYRQRVETGLASNAELMLSQLLGYGRAVVRVTADIDFTRATRTTKVLDPDSKIRLIEQIESEESTSQPAKAQGAVGASANAGTTTTNRSTQRIDGTFTSEKSTSQYDVGSSLDTINEAAGKIKRLTVAAVVDLSPLEEQENGPEITKDQLEGIIKQAVGFDPSRQDEIELLLAPLATAPTSEGPAPIAPWAQYEVLVRNASLGLGGLAALTLGFLILKKVQLPTPAAKNTTLDARRARALATMSESVRRNPDQLKDALRAWLMEEEEEINRESTEERAEAAEAA